MKRKKKKKNLKQLHQYELKWQISLIFFERGLILTVTVCGLKQKRKRGSHLSVRIRNIIILQGKKVYFQDKIKEIP